MTPITDPTTVEQLVVRPNKLLLDGTRFSLSVELHTIERFNNTCIQYHHVCNIVYVPCCLHTKFNLLVQ